MVIHNLLLCLPSWAGRCHHGMTHSLKPCWLRNCHTCHCRMRCQWELSATVNANVVFIAHASVLPKTVKAASCSLTAQCQHQSEISAYQCTTPRLGCPAEMQCCFPPNQENSRLYPCNVLLSIHNYLESDR